MERKVWKMLENGAIQKVVPMQGQKKVLVEKKDRGNPPVINLKNVNIFIPYEDFKMEGLHCLKFLLKQDDLLCKTALKEA